MYDTRRALDIEASGMDLVVHHYSVRSLEDAVIKEQVWCAPTTHSCPSGASTQSAAQYRAFVYECIAFGFREHDQVDAWSLVRAAELHAWLTLGPAQSSVSCLLLCRNKCDPTAIWHGADEYQSTFLDTSMLAYHEELNERVSVFSQ